MFNCYKVYLGAAQIAIFATEQAADNFVHLYSETRWPKPVMSIVPAYIENVGF